MGRNKKRRKSAGRSRAPKRKSGARSTSSGDPAKTPRTEQERFSTLFSLERLRKTWTAIRREAKNHRVRDPIDCLDWAESIESSLPQIRASLLSGDFSPLPPGRYELAKARGSFRIITVPNIRDALVYRVICDKTLELALPYKVRGSFFSRRHDPTPVGRTYKLQDDPYLRFFEVWLRYQTYRTQTLLNDIYDVLVVTDITNYFDSISHELLIEYLAPLGLPRKSMGLLGRLLEALKPPTGHSPNPRIGLPVDEFDCSRELAHVFLFEHDQRIIDFVDEQNYVRWMDDQNIGARDMTHARKIVNRLTESLSSQRLTLNAGKTKFLEAPDVEVYFQLVANQRLDRWRPRYENARGAKLRTAKATLEKEWRRFHDSPCWGKGNSDKILKRFYGYGARIDAAFLEERVYEDLVEHPHLDERIFIYLARRNRGDLLLTTFRRYCDDGESLFEATEGAFFDACLYLDAPPQLERKLREFAKAFATTNVKGQSGKPFGKASAVLCMYWFGAPIRALLGLFDRADGSALPPLVARAWLSVVAARDPRHLRETQARLTGHPSDDVARLSRFLSDLIAGDIERIGNYRHQRPRWPAPGRFYDSRAWLQFELIAQAGSDALRQRASQDVRHFKKLTRSRQERRVLKRVEALLESDD